MQHVNDIGIDQTAVAQQSAARKQAQVAERIEDWLLTKLSEWLVVDREEIDIQERFANYGLSSIAAVSLIGELEDWLEIELVPTLAYEYPNVESLARYVAEQVTLSSAAARDTL